MLGDLLFDAIEEAGVDVAFGIEECGVAFFDAFDVVRCRCTRDPGEGAKVGAQVDALGDLWGGAWCGGLDFEGGVESERTDIK